MCQIFSEKKALIIKIKKKLFVVFLYQSISFVKSPDF